MKAKKVSDQDLFASYVQAVQAAEQRAHFELMVAQYGGLDLLAAAQAAFQAQAA